MRVVNDQILPSQLKRGDLWVREMPEGDVAVVHVTGIRKFKDSEGIQRVHVDYDVNRQHENDAAYTEGVAVHEWINVLRLSELKGK